MITPYSAEELYSLWLNFRGEHDALRILMDFAVCDKGTAKTMIAEFEARHEAQLLNMENRGTDTPHKQHW